MKFLPRSAWETRAGLIELLDALGVDQGDTRFVGGFVRDTLLGSDSADIDCATRLKPEQVVERATESGFKVVPTGIAHGTVTAVLPSGPIEITTLRRDVATDGRRATIAYTEDWRADAARRDFTINALSADPRTGQIHDYFGGLDDLDAGKVRFIGDPLTRIAEDHLRILRFFRFHARFGKNPPDAGAIAACAARANDLMTLSRERIADELVKLMALPDPSGTVAMMTLNGIFRPILPEITDSAADRLSALIAAEGAAGIAPDPLRRLAALLPPDPGTAFAIAKRLKLSNAACKRLFAATGPTEPLEAQALAYRIGRESAIDRLLLGGYPATARDLSDWPVPRLPISGGALVARGLREGPAVAATLNAIEDRWIAEGFPNRPRVEEIADELVRRALAD
ncbi:MAG: CCA tRNA nucleotidyltransferase [Sphingomonadaceae bacterium]